MKFWLLLLPLGALALGGRGTESGRLPRRHTVEMRAMGFAPDTLMVHTGDTVVWINRDIVPHTATAARRWDTGVLTQGAQGRWIAGGTGTIDYVCTLHPTMRGTVIIAKEHS